jgi:hypothetical protein
MKKRIYLCSALVYKGNLTGHRAQIAYAASEDEAIGFFTKTLIDNDDVIVSIGAIDQTEKIIDIIFPDKEGC